MSEPTATPSAPAPASPPHQREPWHRGKLLAIVAFGMVALAGLLSGAALDRYVLYLWSRPGFDRALLPDHRPPGGRGGFGEMGRGFPPPEVTSRLMRELNLTPKQQAEIDSLLDRQAAKLREVRDRVRPQVDSLIEETERAVAARFTPDQRKRYEELRREMRPRGRRGGPPSP